MPVEKPDYPAVLNLLTRAQKAIFLEAHGYTMHPEDAEEEIDFTIAEDIASGTMSLQDLKAYAEAL